ncbi:bifunctional phosphopantothenoylcysteine decarboxylase/phosphopantothenate--cysteine ligase CoaBC [Moraxella lincolnii]|uniref:Coenzyme A biosynthesis bifunctional protein CoaBC n=1 Tax=Lwoffella lincolnii TaxID=90241 RepID=A0A1T0CE61_9GAMM|nr:bifunctional phosphopantothenoylcysteine decarboxylase/phosphopantothenate--cysteine ligase CoaBC [Moraxella lincolnii]OOS20630.1 bifunctional 4'-phosphopantothenoylcysteine decarboxylase/phosphopantothenoylcysteine synthetase [Moraxella lincolnii]
MNNILLAITGGIAAYKSASLARLLVKYGHNVQVIMTKGATAFISPLTLQALTGNAVHTQLLDETAEAGMGHIQLAKWADLLIIAPASANTLARLSMGMADDLLTTVCLATTAPILVAPAMNQQMWANPAVVLNTQTLTDLGYQIIEPASGEQACGDVGAGRLPEPEALFEQVQWALAKQHQPQLLAGKQVVITAGATLEAIDPVRYLSNHSTGKMGYALATACRDAGAEVTLIVGEKVTLTTPIGVQKITVQSADDMLQAAKKTADTGCDVFIATAAVADYRTKTTAPQKIKKTQPAMTLELVKNPDILATISKENPNMFMVGFAAETQDVEKYAHNKLIDKKLDMIACNDVSRQDIGFASDDNAMTVFFADKYQHPSASLAKMPKKDIAKELVNLMAKVMLPHSC